MEFKVTLDGNKKVNAHIGDNIIATDQSVKGGGDGSAPEPYALFLASVGTCAGIYVVFFCEARKIPTDGIELIQKLDFEQVGKTSKLSKFTIEIKVPETFPEKYREPLARAASNCTVKKTILDPPEFDVHTTVA